MANKYSGYTQSLVSFLLDTKPYHSKLTEVIEEFRFNDEMTVNVVEKTFTSNIVRAAWTYPYYSGGASSSYISLKTNSVLLPSVSAKYDNNKTGSLGAFKSNRDEVTDLPGVPYAFNPKAIEGVGLRDAYVQRSGNPSRSEALLEGHDVFLSHGANTFRITRTSSGNTVGTHIKQYTDADGPFPLTVNLAFSADELIISGPATQLSATSISVNSTGWVRVFGVSGTAVYDPEYVDLTQDGVLSDATTAVRASMLGYGANSAITKIADLLSQIQLRIDLVPTATQSAAELSTLLNIIGSHNIPSSYEALLNALEAENVPCIPLDEDGNPYIGWAYHKSALPGVDSTPDVYSPYYVSFKLAELTPSIYHSNFTDLNQRKSGKLTYDDLITPEFTISNIVCNTSRADYEEFTLVVDSSNFISIYGSASGFINSFDVGGTFTSPEISFSSVDHTNGNLTVGDVYYLTPRENITIHAAAPSEAWSIIKVNPLAYSRPVFNSTRYGYIKSAAGIKGYVTFNDANWPAGTIVIRATGSTSFNVTSTSEPSYSATWPVGSMHTDGRLTFQIVQGSAYTFAAGDTFYIEVENDPAVADELGLYYGYDMGPYDTTNLVYNSVSSTIQNYLSTLDFGYDSRFANYDVSNIGLVISNSAVDGRQWRLRAISDLTRPLSGPTENASQLDPWLVRVATTGAITLSGLQTIDGISLAVNDRVLVKNQAVGAANGIYLVRTGAWVRLSTYTLDTSSVFQIDTIRVNFGTINGGKLFDRSTPITSGTYTYVERAADVIDSTDDTDTLPDIKLYYASLFALEYFDGTSWITVSSSVPIGTPYSSTAHGLSFTIIQPAKPFIGAQVVMNGVLFEGGDVIQWTVNNEAPHQLEPASIVSARAPRLIMHGDSFHNSIAARWTLTWVSSTSYRVQGVYTSGVNNGSNVFPTAPTIYLSNGMSYKHPYGVHWTVVNGIAGLASGDTFTFETYDRKPSYLVHGSISGWQKEAAVGEWYWNGKIGFKIKKPEALLFSATGGISNSKPDVLIPDWSSFSIGAIVLNHLRFDCSPCLYHAISHVDGHWTLYRDGLVVGTGTTVLEDTWIKLSVPVATKDDQFFVQIKSQNIPLSAGNDLAIVKTTAGRKPTSSDFVVFERTEYDKIDIAIRAIDGTHSTTLAPLARLTTDIRFVDHSANSGVPLENTSPEISTLAGWLPLICESNRTFPDVGTVITAKSASTGETIGSISGTTFTWNTAFHNTYLPLNSESIIVTRGSGTDEVLHVNMHDFAMFMLDGGSSIDNALFSDVMTVDLLDNEILGSTPGQSALWQFKNTSLYSETASTTVLDGPFNGFLPGYDNLAYDLEDGVDGYFDAGQALLGHFEEAKTLYALSSRTAEEELRLADLISLINPYLDGSLADTSLNEFMAAVAADESINSTNSTHFGIPSIGMGTQLSEKSTSNASTAIVEAMEMQIVRQGSALDDFGTGTPIGLDTVQQTVTVLVANDLPPTPNSGLPSVGITYADFQTPLTVTLPASTIQINFTTAPAVTPAFYVWFPTAPAPQPISVIEIVSPRVFRFSIPSASELKVIAL